MRSYPLLIIGGGLSGLAAGIRFARFGQKVLILEKHSKPGGLNSYYYRKGRLLETGLHAVTNFAPPEDKHAPLNRLFRQLKIPRRTFKLREQFTSEVLFPGRSSLCFSNDDNLLQSQVADNFPDSVGQFAALTLELDKYDPFTPQPKISARKFVSSFLQDSLLVEMLFCPMMFYGGSDEDDMDLSQFVILFRSIFQEGFFRPAGTIKDLLDLLVAEYKNFGGEIELSTGVKEILTDKNSIIGVRTDSGKEISCDCLVSTAGLPETKRLFATADSAAKFSTLSEAQSSGRLSFTESIYLLDKPALKTFTENRTIVFFNLAENFTYHRPDEAVDLNSGVICFPDNFQGSTKADIFQLRVTHLANYDIWRNAYDAEDKSLYRTMKKHWIEYQNKRQQHCCFS